ncbi:hypothetical protein L1887_55311 [Cichorium endivia]|nr:hypothetical protein L1887_55311 [Cichorium endivia]
MSICEPLWLVTEIGGSVDGEQRLGLGPVVVDAPVHLGDEREDLGGAPHHEPGRRLGEREPRERRATTPATICEDVAVAVDVLDKTVHKDGRRLGLHLLARLGRVEALGPEAHLVRVVGVRSRTAPIRRHWARRAQAARWGCFLDTVMVGRAGEG